MTRISLALAIARIFPPKEATRRFAAGLALLSTAFCLVIVIQSGVICAHQPALVSGPNAACQWPNSLRTLVVFGTLSATGFIFTLSDNPPSKHILGFVARSHSTVQVVAGQTTKEAAPAYSFGLYSQCPYDICHCCMCGFPICTGKTGTWEDDPAGKA